MITSSLDVPVSETGDLYRVQRLMNGIPGVAIAGGAARELVFPKIPATDIDVFCTKDAFDEVHRRLVDQSWMQWEIKTGRTGSVYTYAYQGTHPLSDASPRQVEVVRLANDPPADVARSNELFLQYVMSRFAFTTEQFGIIPGSYTPKLRVFYPLGGTFEDTQRKRLVILDNALGADHTDPIRVARRLAKYGAKGFTITTYETTKIFTAWNRLTLPQQVALLEAHQNDNHGYGIE